MVLEHGSCQIIKIQVNWRKVHQTVLWYFARAILSKQSVAETTEIMGVMIKCQRRENQRKFKSEKSNMTVSKENVMVFSLQQLRLLVRIG